MTAHAKYAPSSMARIVACSGSAEMAARVPPQPEDEATKEGTVAHWVAHQMWLGTTPEVGSKHLDVEITDEMIAGGRLWCETVGRDGIPEMRVYATSIHPTLCDGTPDFWNYDSETETLIVPEYKFGHLFVDEFENWQGLTYAQGVMDTAGFQPKNFIIGVVQPRCYSAPPVRWWHLDRAKFDSYIERIRQAIATPDVTTSGPQCAYCPARLECSTFQQNVSNVVRYLGAPELSPSTPAQRGAELTLLTEASKLLEARKLALEEYAASEIRAGRAVPGWELKPGQSKLTWLLGAADVLAAGDALGLDLRAPPAPVTPTQAIERKLLDAETAKAIAWRPPASLKLSPVSTATTRRLFS